MKIGKHGDPTTTRGVVIATLSSLFDGNVRLAVAGDRATCGNCKGTWPIVATGECMTDAGRAVVLEGDVVTCPCRKNRVIAMTQDMGYQVLGAARATSAAAGAAMAVAAALKTVEPAARPATPVIPVTPVSRDRTATERRCTLRIGVFFDGTGNNAGNTQLLEQCKASTGDALQQSQADQQAIAAHCKPYMLKEHTSYEGGYTNVWRLYQLYRDSSKGAFEDESTNYFVPIYIQGIGTTVGKPDTLLPGYAFGTGETGVSARVAEVITESIPERIKEFCNQYIDFAIEGVEFDVFGFSRGAAAARHFVNQVNRKRQGPLAPALANARVTATFEMDDDVRVGFVGLFDTVVSYASLADGFNVRAGRTGPLHVGLPAGCARKVVQIAARDEHRANFMLTTVAPEHQEIELPGVHSDIGGGYRSREEGPLMLIEPIRHDEPLASLPALRNGLSQSRAWREAEQLLHRWRRQLGNIDADTPAPATPDALAVDAWLVVRHQRTSRESVVKQTIPSVYATLRLQRPIDPGYQLIALRMMHKLAVEAGVILDAIDDHDPDYQLPDQLKSIAAKLLAGQSLDTEEEALLARNYLHQSAHWNFGSNVTYLQSGVSVSLLYPNRPERGRQRKLLPNT